MERAERDRVLEAAREAAPQQNSAPPSHSQPAVPKAAAECFRRKKDHLNGNSLGLEDVLACTDEDEQQVLLPASARQPGSSSPLALHTHALCTP